MAATNITKENFQTEVLDSDVPVLLDFWAEWCGPCRMLGPVIDEIAADASGFRVGKVNVDSEPELAGAYHVMSIPTLVVVKNGEVAATSVGVKPKQAILDMLEAAK